MKWRVPASWLHGVLIVNKVDSKFSLIPSIEMERSVFVCGRSSRRTNDLAATSLRTFNITLTLISEPRAFYSRSIHSPSLPLFTDSYSVLMVCMEMCAVSPVMAFHKSLRVHSFPITCACQNAVSALWLRFCILIVRFRESGF